jgi:type IV pilus assembly protein PilC
MPSFAYTVRDATGTVHRGVSEAENDSILARRLKEQGLKVQSIKRAKAAVKPGQQRVWGRVKLHELSIFCRQFSTMIDAGVSLVRCLSVLQEQSQSPKLKSVLADIQSEVEAGQTLSRAMARHPGTFKPLFIGLIRAGEVGGVLEESLQRLSQFLEKDVELRRKVKSAMTYPVIVILVALAIVIGLVTFILPKFISLFEELGVTDFPAMTLMLMNFSHFLTTYWYIALGILGALFVAFKLFTGTKFGKRVYDRFKLKMPVFGSLNHKIALARFSRTLGTLLVSGVPILQALETVAGTVDNDIISDAVLDARARIREGDRIGDPLQKSKMFPPMVVQMISIGEESGALDQMLSKIADFYEQEVDSALQSLTAAIEPVMIVFLGGAVGFIVIAMFLPLVSLIQGLSGDSGDE